MVFDKIKEIIIANMGVPADSITLDSSFVVDIGMDIADFITFIMDVEDTFHIDEISDTRALGLLTVGDMVEHVQGIM